MTADKDHLFFGEIITSFRVDVYAPDPENSPHGNSIACLFVLSTGGQRTIELSLEALSMICAELKLSLDRFPEARQRKYFDALASNERLFDQAFDRLVDHPVMQYKINIPDQPKVEERFLTDRLVKFTHFNIYPDVFKFDFTFVSGDTTRLSMPSSVAEYFHDTLETAGSAARQLR